METTGSIHDLEPQLANLRSFWLGFGKREYDGGDPTLYRSDVPHPLCNGVLRLCDGEGVDEAFAETKRRLRGVPWLWWVGPDSHPHLAGSLLTRGVTQILTMPVMAAPTDRVRGSAGPPELEIEEVSGPEALREWVSAWVPAYGLDPNLVEPILGREEDRSDGSEGLVRFAGRMGGEVVASSVLFDRNGVAGIYEVATKEGHRRQGIGAAMSEAAVRAGRERGLSVATLQATTLGRSVYERLGFEAVSEYRLFGFEIGRS